MFNLSLPTALRVAQSLGFHDINDTALETDGALVQATVSFAWIVGVPYHPDWSRKR